MLDFHKIQNTDVNRQPYPYMVITDSIQKESVDGVIASFPNTSGGGSIPVQLSELDGDFKSLIEDIEGVQLKDIIQEKFSVDLENKPIVTTVRSLMRQKDGRIHTDSKSKIITVLLYLNKDWPSDDAHLRILNNGKDINDYVEQVRPLAGTMIIFEVTDNCWHGHTPMVGKRLSLQMNYLVSQSSKTKHSFFHNLSKKIKNVFGSSNQMS